MLNAFALFRQRTGRSLRTGRAAAKPTTDRAYLSVERLEGRALLSILLTNQHTDIDAAYSGGVWDMDQNNKAMDPIGYYEPDKVTLGFLPGAKKARTSDSRFDFIGVPPGDPVWIVPISPRDPNLLQLGVSGERISSGTFDSYRETDPRINNVIPFPWIRFTVLDVRGPGYFSVWQTDDFGSPTVWVATSPGGNANPNLFFSAPGGHVDYNWAFTAPGDYYVDIQASAYVHYPDQPTMSDVTTYHFLVMDDPGGPSTPAPHLAFPAGVVPQVAESAPSPVGSTAVIGAPLSAPSDQSTTQFLTASLALGSGSLSLVAVDNSLASATGTVENSWLTEPYQLSAGTGAGLGDAPGRVDLGADFAPPVR
jgi:surface-anchored protein